MEHHGLVLGGLAAVVAVEDVLPGLAQVLQRRLLVEPEGGVGRGVRVGLSDLQGRV